MFRNIEICCLCHLDLIVPHECWMAKFHISVSKTSGKHWNQWNSHCPSQAQMSPAAEDLQIWQSYDRVLQFKEQECDSH